MCESNLSGAHNVSFKNYAIVRNDKVPQKPVRGTAIILKLGIPFTKVNTTLWNLKSLEVTAVLV